VERIVGGFDLGQSRTTQRSALRRSPDACQHVHDTRIAHERGAPRDARFARDGSVRPAGDPSVARIFRRPSLRNAALLDRDPAS